MNQNQVQDHYSDSYIDESYTKGWSPLQKSCYKGNIERVQKILSKKNVNLSQTTTRGESLFDLTLMNKNNTIDIAKLLFPIQNSFGHFYLIYIKYLKI